MRGQVVPNAAATANLIHAVANNGGEWISGSRGRACGGRRRRGSRACGGRRRRRGSRGCRGRSCGRRGGRSCSGCRGCGGGCLGLAFVDIQNLLDVTFAAITSS